SYEIETGLEFRRVLFRSGGRRPGGRQRGPARRPAGTPRRAQGPAGRPPPPPPPPPPRRPPAGTTAKPCPPRTSAPPRCPGSAGRSAERRVGKERKARHAP